VPGLSLGTGPGASGDTEEWIAGRIGRRGDVQRFEAGSGFAPMGKYEAFALGNAAQDALGVLAELKHGDGLHGLNFNLKLKWFKPRIQPGVVGKDGCPALASYPSASSSGPICAKQFRLLKHRLRGLFLFVGRIA
jgi:hypothetical protein